MKGIGGNITGMIQTATTTTNAIGEAVQTWTDVQTLWGWLDLASGDSKYTTYSTKITEATHIFLADYVPLSPTIKAETARMAIGGNTYDITYLDNPMGLGSGSHWEIFLRSTGGAA